jgi:hypothetical protein
MATLVGAQAQDGNCRWCSANPRKRSFLHPNGTPGGAFLPKEATMLPRWTPTRRAVLQAIGLGGLQVGMLLAGVVVVESIFAWPGLGLYTARAITSVDFPAIAGVTLVMGAVYVIVNALVDLAQVAADPRLRAR